MPDRASSLDHAKNPGALDLRNISEMALSHIADFVYVFDREGRFVYANKALLDLWGLTLEQAAGRNFFDLQYPHELAMRLQAQIQQVIKTGRQVKDETPYTSPTGREGYYEYIFNPYFAADGSVAAVVGSTHIMTERKRSEDAARRLAAIVESSQDAIVSKTLEGIITSWNQGAAALFGYSEEEAVGKPISVLIPQELYDKEEPEIIDHIRHGRRVEHFETVRLRKDGSHVNVSLTISPIRDEEGRVVGASKIARDITERKLAEEKLGRARQQADDAAAAAADAAERFRLVAEVTSLQIWTASSEGTLEWANQECANYFQTDLETQVLGSAWAQFVHPDDLSVTLDRWRVSLGSGARYETEFRLKRHDGVYRWFLVRAEAMRGPAGEITRWFGTNTDIDALKNAQNEAERSSRAKDAFLATLSHELRTPLTPVLMAAASMREDERIPRDAREQLGMMERNIALEARLIDDMLDLTRISRGQIHMRPKACDAHTLIRLALEMVQDDARGKGIRIEQHFAARHHGLVIDPARFQQVIWNLLRNAVKFTPAGGTITILTRNQPSAEGAPSLRVEVVDSGIGIDPAKLDKIFLPFDQGSLAGDHRYGGLGLGLAIARAIVDLHGGAITAQSGGTGRGSTFIVDLPGATAFTGESADPAEKARAGAPAEEQPEEAVSLRLLLVEDHESTLRVLSRLLTRAGHRVVAAGSIADARRAASIQPFDLVISDLGLPDGTGLELMEALRKTHGLGGIALSGYGMEADIERSREAGFIAHLTKPVDFQQLKGMLEEVAKDVGLHATGHPWAKS
ncbi:MAG TPA: PAS domain S-box protein [Chthoniobacteraceae bacterium]|nr:PAS domain S-box protein [Chthoniobacteraceae bacterium]